MCTEYIYNQLGILGRKKQVGCCHIDCTLDITGYNSTNSILLSLPDAGVKASPNPAYQLTPPAFSVVLDFLSISSSSSSLLLSLLSHPLFSIVCFFDHNHNYQSHAVTTYSHRVVRSRFPPVPSSTGPLSFLPPAAKFVSTL